MTPLQAWWHRLSLHFHLSTYKRLRHDLASRIAENNVAIERSDVLFEQHQANADFYQRNARFLADINTGLKTRLESLPTTTKGTSRP
jgi:hypothetical protein